MQNPVYDKDEVIIRKTPDGREVSCRYLHGTFDETNVRFSFFFPVERPFVRRIFQHISPFPGPNEEDAGLGKYGEEDFIAFAVWHGAAYCECNMGSTMIFGSAEDPTIFYRANAAAANECKNKAKELFGCEKVYAYCFGGSGGGYKTMSCIENTDAYDGAVPFVIGSPMSLPNCLTVAAHGSRLLRHAWPKIVDAFRPGGSGNPEKDLNEQELAAYRELLQIGFPPRMCCLFEGTDDGSLPVLTPGVKAMDPTYFTDYWTKEGYLGYDTNGTADGDRVHLETVITGISLAKDGTDDANASSVGIDSRNGTDDAWQKMMVDAGELRIAAGDIPHQEDPYLRGVDIIFLDGGAEGKKLRLERIEGNTLIPGVSFGADDAGEIYALAKAGDRILLDNSDYIAIQSYHRHQVPEDRSFHAWDQYRNEDGTPKYPQRPYVIAYGFTAGGCGSVQDGQIQGKVMVMNSLMDGDFPWQADWYRHKVEEIQGEKAPDMFRIYYNDNCPHGDVEDKGAHSNVVSYLGMLQQALLDLSDWVERDIQPKDNSGYDLVDNQVILKDTPEERRGLQPMVRLLAQSRECAHVKTGETVHLLTEVKLPEGCGELCEVEWSLNGEDFHKGEPDITVSYDEPGVYFPMARIITRRDPEDPFCNLRNLAEARVIVEA